MRFNFEATGIGSLPFKDSKYACRLILENFKSIPFWPQLPKRSYREHMYCQFVEGLPGVVIDEASYSAKVHGRPLDLTFKEFELLRFLAQHPGRVFTREQLLSEVWGYDYFGGTRTVDVHIRRLRAKLGDLESLIGTVRNVGYRFNLNDDADLDQEVAL